MITFRFFPLKKFESDLRTSTLVLVKGPLEHKLSDIKTIISELYAVHSIGEILENLKVVKTNT